MKTYVVCGVSSRALGMNLRAGVAKVDITTDREGIVISDPLYAKALVLDDGAAQVVIVAMASRYCFRRTGTKTATFLGTDKRTSSPLPSRAGTIISTDSSTIFLGRWTITAPMIVPAM